MSVDLCISIYVNLYFNLCIFIYFFNLCIFILNYLCFIILINVYLFILIDNNFLQQEISEFPGSKNSRESRGPGGGEESESRRKSTRSSSRQVGRWKKI